MKEFKVYPRDDGRYLNYCFVDGQHKDEVAFGFKKNAYVDEGFANACFHNKDSDASFHLLAFELVDPPKPPVPNTVVVKSSCGEVLDVDLGISEGQPISEVIVRGVKYVKEDS